MKNNQLSEEEHELLDLFNQADSDTQDFLVWAVKYIATHQDDSVNIYDLEKQYFGNTVDE